MPVFEFEHADDPALELIEATDAALIVVKATPITQQRSSSGSRDDFAEWSHAILSWMKRVGLFHL